MLEAMKAAAFVAILISAGLAHAGPTTRFGLTGGIANPTSPGGGQLGPMVALGERAGAFVVEVDYAYLSFFGADVDHRFGLNLRADLFRSESSRCLLTYACTRGATLFGEIGSAERFGHVPVDAQNPMPVETSQPEAHVGIGLELENQLIPHRNGWQLGLRFAITHGAPTLGTACRGSNCSSTTTVVDNGVATSVFFEWMYVLGN
jgi:hypothetical protein